MLEPMEHERRLHLYRQGLNDREIAERLYLTPEAITHWRKTHELPAHSPRRWITPEMAEEMARMHREGASDGQIAKQMNMPKPTVAAWRIRNGLKANFTRGHGNHADHHH